MIDIMENGTGFTATSYGDMIDLSDQQYEDWGLRAIGADKAWARTRGSGVRVAIIDTGWSDHPDLAPNIVLTAGNKDTQGHGTHVSGIVAALDNAFGVVGVAPEAKLLVNGCMPGSGADLIAAIQWAIDNHAQVISMSLGCYDDMPGLEDMVQKAYAAGIVIVAAAGNDPTRIAYPGIYPECIAVTALDPQGQLEPFAPQCSNHLGCPGGQILSTWLDGQYARLSGTSQATPMIAGAVALMLALPHEGDVHEYVQRELLKIAAKTTGWAYEPNLALL